MTDFTVKDTLWRIKQQNNPHYAFSNFRHIDTSLDHVSTVVQVPGNLISDPVISLARAEWDYSKIQLSNGEKIYKSGLGPQNASEAQNLMIYQQGVSGLDEAQEVHDFFSPHDDFMAEPITGDFFDHDMIMPFEEIDNAVSQPEMVFEAECFDEIDDQSFMEAGPFADDMADEPIEEMEMSAYGEGPMEEMMEMEQPEAMMDAFDPMDPMNDPFNPMNPFGMTMPCEMLLEEPGFF